MKLLPIVAALAACGLSNLREIQVDKMISKVEHPRNLKTKSPYVVQKAVYEAAVAKRARREARNLAYAGITQEELL